MESTNHTCKNCGNSFTGKYCNQCGQKIFSSKDKNILHFFEESFHFITHFEGIFFNSFKTVLRSPGKMSFDYTNGIQKKYFKPLSLFLILVILYLIFPFYVGLNMPFKFYLNEKSYAAKMVEKKSGVNIDSIKHIIYTDIEAKNFTTNAEAFSYAIKKTDTVFSQIPKLQKLEASYNKKSDKVSKILLLLLIPLSALVLYILFWDKRKYFYDHLTFATEINCFYLIFSFFLMPFITRLMFSLLTQFSLKYITDYRIGVISSIVFGIYNAYAFKRFYKLHWLIALFAAAIFVCFHQFIVDDIYKGLLFVITLFLSK